MIAITVEKVWGFWLSTDLRWETKGWFSGWPHTFSKTTARGSWGLDHGVTGTEALSLCFHSLRSHCKRWCAPPGPHKRDLDPPGASPQKSWPLHFRSQGTIITKKGLFQEVWRGRRFKEKMRLQNWNQWTEETRKQLLAQCQSKHSKTRAYKTSCLQAESSPQMGFVWTAVGLQLY